jgi:hypothetical protein
VATALPSNWPGTSHQEVTSSHGCKGDGGESGFASQGVLSKSSGTETEYFIFSVVFSLH